MNTTTSSPTPQVAFIREDECIGCTKCRNACPVDAIVGSTRFLHTVITADCTGCALCITPCPMDCIELRPAMQPVENARVDWLKQRKLKRVAAQFGETTNASKTPVLFSPTPKPVVTKTADEHQKLKTAVSMTQVALSKAEQQFKRRPSPVLEAQIAKLRLAAQQAQERLNRALTPSPHLAARDELHQAKVHLVEQRAALKQAEQRGVTEAELAPLRQAVAKAEQALHQAEASTERPQPERVLSYKQPVSTQVRDLKTELALARAAVHKFERQPLTDPAVLQQARIRLQKAEQQLADYLAQSSTPEMPSA